ncbi:MAG: hypothetical protein K0R58_1162 [Ramlibacter sp.]|nr:hypothetical protein [Ramlibacter sp.]
MSLLKWFYPQKKKAGDAPVDAGLSRLESSRPHSGGRHAGGTVSSAVRKQERLERRELLYAVVRESMVRAGVLSSSYKFKVLSLDPRGRQFMVMVDLAQGAHNDTNKLSEIEAMVAQSAKARYDIAVSAVYWRANEHVAIGDPAHPTHPVQLAKKAEPVVTSRPMPLQPDAIESGPAPLYEPMSSRSADLRAAVAQRFDPLQADEVAAFQKALAAGVRGEKALAAVNAGKPAPQQSYTLLTGFEDTELSEQAGPQEHLSSTQYGALR